MHWQIVTQKKQFYERLSNSFLLVYQADSYAQFKMG
jgi:hypothetical protein